MTAPVVRRVAGVLALLAIPITVSAAWTHAATRPAINACCMYRPVVLTHGRLWTVLGSSVLLINPNPFGSTVLFSALVLVPFAALTGVKRAASVFLIGHVVTTAAVAAVVLPGNALGWQPAVQNFHLPDVGMSAGLAAVAGGLVAVAARRRRWVAVVLMIVFAARFAGEPAQGRYLVGLEHYIAAVVGYFLERRLDTESAARAARWKRPRIAVEVT